MLLIDVQPYGSDVLHLSISTKTYWWHQLLPNGGNLFVHLIVINFKLSIYLQYTFSYLPLIFFTLPLSLKSTYYVQ